MCKLTEVVERDNGFDNNFKIIKINYIFTSNIGFYKYKYCRFYNSFQFFKFIINFFF